LAPKVAAGTGFTVIVTLAVEAAEHPVALTVTVYVVVAAGVTVTTGFVPDGGLLH
jgi:hypothetical protein